MNPIESILSRYPLMVLDCALGTEIAKRGFDTNDSLWSAKALYERPELIREIFEEYYDQGADLVATASYQATIPGFEAKGFSHDESADLIRKYTNEREMDRWAATRHGAVTPERTVRSRS